MAIYFIQMGEGGPVKIGRSRNVRSRLVTFHTMLPGEPIVLGVIDAADEANAERALHARFRAAAIRNEWFAPTPDLLAYIAEHAVQFAFKAPRRRSVTPDWLARHPDMPPGARRVICWMDAQGIALSYLEECVFQGSGRLRQCIEGKRSISPDSVAKLAAFTGLDLRHADFQQQRLKKAA